MASRAFFRPRGRGDPSGTTTVNIPFVADGGGPDDHRFGKRQACFVLTYLVCWLPSFVFLFSLFAQGQGDFVLVAELPPRNFSKLFF